MCHGKYFQTFPVLEDAVQQPVVVGDRNLKWIAAGEEHLHSLDPFFANI